MSEIRITEAVVSRAYDIARVETFFPVVEIDDAGPQSPDTEADYRALSKRGVNTVLEIGVTDFSLEVNQYGMALQVRARSRLFRTKDGKLLEQYLTGYRSEFRSYNEWAAADAENLRHALQKSYQYIAESAVEQHLLVYRLGGQSLRAVYPLGSYEFVMVDSARPTLRWEKLKDLLARVDAKDIQGVSNVSYDLRVFLATPGKLKVPGELIYEKRFLAEPRHTFEKELEPCEMYFWAVRARFSLGGRLRLTKWSSLRRSDEEADNYATGETNYYRFRAPSAYGRCKD